MTQSAEEDGNPMSPHPIPRPGAPSAPAPLRKIAIEEHILDPQLSHIDYTKLAPAAGMTPEFWEVAFKRLRDDSARLEEMDAPGIEVHISTKTVSTPSGKRSRHKIACDNAIRLLGLTAKMPTA
jgi:hypothetical protein